MTSGEYIEKLTEVLCNLDCVKYDLNFAIHRILRRVETGDESMERDIRRVVLAGREYIKKADKQLRIVATSKIEYSDSVSK